MSYSSFLRQQRYIGFDETDVKHLQEIRKILTQDHLNQVIDQFYEVLLSDDKAKSVFKDKQQISRQKQSLRSWFEKTLVGPYGEDYYKSRLNIGLVHVRVGLAQEFMFLGMNVIRRAVSSHLLSLCERDKAKSLVSSFNKVIDLDLSIMVGAYSQLHEDEAVRDFRTLIFKHLPLSILLLDKSLNLLEMQIPDWPIFQKNIKYGAKVLDVFVKNFSESIDLEHVFKKMNANEDMHYDKRIELEISGHKEVYMLTIIRLNHQEAEFLLHLEHLTAMLTAQEKLQEMKSLAQLGTMAATVAHEIRNPIAGIANTLQVIENSMSEDEKYKKIIGKVQKEIFRLGDLVGELLSFSRPVQIRLKESSLNRITESAVHDALRELGGSVKITVSGDDTCLIDVDWLHRGLLNLIQNATQAGASLIDIKIQNKKIYIYDNGGGISEDAQSKIFDAFFTTKIRGTGLGLATVKKAIEAMGGTIALEKSTPEGTVFSITFI